MQTSLTAVKRLFESHQYSGEDKEALPVLPIQYVTLPEEQRVEELYSSFQALIFTTVNQSLQLQWCDVGYHIPGC